MAERSGSRKAVKVKRGGSKRETMDDEGAAIAFDPTKHELVPKHEKLSEKEKADLLEHYHATIRELPKISAADPALSGMSIKPGDVIKITRKSYTAGETVFYRGVVDE